MRMLLILSREDGHMAIDLKSAGTPRPAIWGVDPVPQSSIGYLGNERRGSVLKSFSVTYISD